MFLLETEMRVMRVDRVCDACDEGSFRTKEVERVLVAKKWCWRMLHVCSNCNRVITEHNERVTRWPKYENRGVL